MSDLLFEEKSFKIRGGAFEVYREKGHGFLEPVYQDCMEHELQIQKIPHEAFRPLALSYKGLPLKQKYIPDLICFQDIIVELKAVKKLTDEHRSQVLNYLKATGSKLGLLINFGHFPKAEIERLVL